MLDSRHAPRYLRWFDGIALLGGGATLIILMAMLATGMLSQKNSEQGHSPRQRASLDDSRLFTGSYLPQRDEERNDVHQSW